MGLASAMSTALTGLTAAETTIDVVGNNLANSNTVGFKESSASFATQFLQTQSLGSSPTAGSGGTNPRQVGLGTMVAEIAPSFTQGTIEISANPTDLAIQGDGFFIVQGARGEQLYSRNGIFKLNSQSELVTVTGNRLLGHGVDSDFQTVATSLVPLTIPLGAAAVAKATENVYLEGTLSPTGDLADTAEVIQTGIMSDGVYRYPETACTAGPAIRAPLDGVTHGQTPGGDIEAGTYYYRLVYADGPYGALNATEGTASNPYQVVVVDDDSSVTINGVHSNPLYSHVRLYRTTMGVPNPDTADYRYVDEVQLPAGPPHPAVALTDRLGDGALGPPLVGTVDLDAGLYEYYVTFYNEAGVESRPSRVSGRVDHTLGSNRIHLANIPAADPLDPYGWTHTRIYRNQTGSFNEHYLLAHLNGVDGGSFTDNVSNDSLVVTREHLEPIYGPDPPLFVLDRDGPKISDTSFVLDMVRRDGSTYESLFSGPGVLQFAGRKGGRTLAMKEFEITATTRVLELRSFMVEAMGIQNVGSSAGQSPGPPGGDVTGDGRILLRGNNGVDSTIAIGLAGMKFIRGSDSAEENINMPFASIQSARGESAVADFIAYDSLGIPLSVRLTAVLDSRTSTATTYRWFADSPNNDPDTGSRIAVGTGLISFDGNGNFSTSTETRVSIDRRNVSSASPLEFELDFRQLSGLATENSTLAVSRQDGSAPGVLTSFIMGEDGRIRGVFSNGITRDLGQIILARFANPAGLEQIGRNLYATGVNSGLPVEGNPNQQGIGSIIAGAQELSNTDIGGNLIDLILAATMYRGNTRVITTAQQMFDELLALRR